MKFLIANWKMNGDIAFADSFLKTIFSIKTQHKVVICPPYPLLYKFQNCPFDIGAQNCHHQTTGAFTGEVSPLLLKELGCKYVIIGHSERRSLFNESDATIFEKYKLLLQLNITPIVCIGETAEQKDIKDKVLSQQLLHITQTEDYLLQKTIIAYEPIWSIGTGQIPSIQQIESSLSYIKKLTKNLCPTLYGGSVNKSNFSQLLQIPSLDGALIGGASLKLDEFPLMMTCNG